MFYYLIDLHYSQTFSALRRLFSPFYYLIDLHYSQTIVSTVNILQLLHQLDAVLRAVLRDGDALGIHRRARLRPDHALHLHLRLLAAVIPLQADAPLRVEQRFHQRGRRLGLVAGLGGVRYGVDLDHAVTVGLGDLPVVRAKW